MRPSVVLHVSGLWGRGGMAATFLSGPPARALLLSPSLCSEAEQLATAAVLLPSEALLLPRHPGGDPC